MGLLAIILVFIGYYRGAGEHLLRLKSAMEMTIQILPMVILVFIVAGMIQILIPQELLSNWIGKESGMRGILIGTLAGGLAPGNPYVNLPIAAGLLRSGATIGAMVAFLTGWSLWSFVRLPIEVSIMAGNLHSFVLPAHFSSLVLLD
jgi:uncharacterized membrane protein YraQ (UPF0718 family)